MPLRKIKYNPDIHHRRSIRLKNYDYLQEGAYFVTICSRNQEEIFPDEQFRNIVEHYWLSLPRHYPHTVLDEFVIMPNHIHGIIILVGAGSADRTGNAVRSDKPAHLQPRRAGLAGLRPAEPAPTIANPKRHSLAEVIRFFKTYSAREINRMRKTPGEPVWQRNYYEHIIRSEEKMNKIREYILANPAQWENDPENPAAQKEDSEKEFWQKVVV